MGERYNVVIVGAGHNGLVAAGYLAKAGKKVLVLERRHVVGGAAVSEHPFGPDFTVTSLSYVVSWLPAGMVRDLRLTEHGYHVYPQGPYFAPRRDGRYLALPSDGAARRGGVRALFVVAGWSGRAGRAAAGAHPAEGGLEAPPGPGRPGRPRRA